MEFFKSGLIPHDFTKKLVCIKLQNTKVFKAFSIFTPEPLIGMGESNSVLGALCCIVILATVPMSIEPLPPACRAT